jgi:hypothetical protein
MRGYVCQVDSDRSRARLHFALSIFAGRRKLVSDYSRFASGAGVWFWLVSCTEGDRERRSFSSAALQFSNPQRTIENVVLSLPSCCWSSVDILGATRGSVVLVSLAA